MPLPPWIKSLQRPLDRLAIRRQSYDYVDLPETEPGEQPALPLAERPPVPSERPAQYPDLPFERDPSLEDTLEDIESPLRRSRHAG